MPQGPRDSCVFNDPNSEKSVHRDFLWRLSYDSDFSEFSLSHTHTHSLSLPPSLPPSLPSSPSVHLSLSLASRPRHYKFFVIIIKNYSVLVYFYLIKVSKNSKPQKIPFFFLVSPADDGPKKYIINITQRKNKYFFIFFSWQPTMDRSSIQST